VLRLLAALGTGFDCASKREIQQIVELGVDPSRIIYAQPCKTKSYLRYAKEQGVKKMTFDNSEELYKIKDVFPEAELFLRILTDDSQSQCRLSVKFGASTELTGDLLQLAKALGLNVVGVSFHVGSGDGEKVHAFTKAVEDARFVFDQAESLGFTMTTLDVGGGFCSDTFESTTSVLNAALSRHFPSSVQLIGEPGRYYVASAFTLACHVIARRTIQNTGPENNAYMLYLNDGVYGNFSNIIFDHQHPVPQALKVAGKYYPSFVPSGKYGHALPVDYSVWGPTCDGIDKITDRWQFEGVIDVGDWLLFREMGGKHIRYSSLFMMNAYTDNFILQPTQSARLLASTASQILTKSSMSAASLLS
jgi:ornithine decarboxylase